jgi:hypothetical protein
LNRQLHRVFYWNAHNARAAIHPAVRRQRLLFGIAKGLQVVARIGLKPRFRRQAVLLGRGQRELRRSWTCLASLEVLEQHPDDERDREARDEEAGTEDQDAADVDVALLVVRLGVSRDVRCEWRM